MKRFIKQSAVHELTSDKQKQIRIFKFLRNEESFLSRFININLEKFDIARLSRKSLS